MQKKKGFLEDLIHTQAKKLRNEVHVTYTPVHVYWKY